MDEAARREGLSAQGLPENGRFVRVPARENGRFCAPFGRVRRPLPGRRKHHGLAGQRRFLPRGKKSFQIRLTSPMKHAINFIESLRAARSRMEGKAMVFERIREIMCEQLDLEEDSVTMESDIMEDFEADSLDLVDLVMSLEDEFNMEVPDDQIENFRTVGDVVRYIEENS